MQRVVDITPADWRGPLGFRGWATLLGVSIRRGRVQSVSAMTLVEGQSRWLGHEWSLAEHMPHHDMAAQPYLIGTANLSMADGGGIAIENYFTPVASQDEQAAARTFNNACVTSLRGCDDLCGLAPLALEYLRPPPEAAWNIVPPKCSEQP